MKKVMQRVGTSTPNPSTPKRRRTSGSSRDRERKKIREHEQAQFNTNEAGGQGSGPESSWSSPPTYGGREGDRSWTEEVEEEMEELEEYVTDRGDGGGGGTPVSAVDSPDQDLSVDRAIGVARSGAAAGAGAEDPKKRETNGHGGRQANVEIRSGDWICPRPRCGNWNFSRRQMCNRCHAVRPGTDGDGDDEIAGPARTWAERTKSAFLITVTGGGENLSHLSKQQHWEIMEKLEDEIFKENSTLPPAIDWVSWKQRSMIACADQRTVNWVKQTIPAIDRELGAWLPTEGPYARKKYRIKVPLPTGNRPAAEVLDRIVVGNKLDGLLTRIAEIRTERALVLVVAADDEMVTSLKTRDCGVYCGVTRLTFREECMGPGPPLAVGEIGEHQEPEKNKKD